MHSWIGTGCAILDRLFPTVVSVVWRFPRGPVGPYRARPQPLPVHQRDGVLRLHLLGEAHEAVAFRLQRLRVPHHSAVAERGEVA